MSCVIFPDIASCDSSMFVCSNAMFSQSGAPGVCLTSFPVFLVILCASGCFGVGFHHCQIFY